MNTQYLYFIFVLAYNIDLIEEHKSIAEGRETIEVVKDIL